MTDSAILCFLRSKWMAFLRLFYQTWSYRLMHRVYHAVAGAWTNSALVRAFCRDSNPDNTVNHSLIFKIFYLPFAFFGLFAGKKGVKVADWWKTTAVWRVCYCLAHNLIALNTRFLGVMLLSGGAVYLVAARSLTAILPLAAAILGAVLCLFDVSLLRALGYSIVKWFFKTFLAIEPRFDYDDEAQTSAKGRLWIALGCGLVGGFLAAYVSPLAAVGILGVVVCLFSVEFAVGATVFAIPFIPTMAAAGLVILCFVSLFFRKMGDGDRVWKFDALGLLIVLLMVIILVCSLTSVAVSSSIQICLLYFAFMSFYFTIINTVKTKQQVYTMLAVFVVSGFFVAAYGIIQYVFGLDMDKQVWIDEEMFSDIKMRAFSTLENPNVLGEYLLLVIPVSIAFLWCKKGVWAKVGYAGVTGVLLLCLVLTMSRGCWVGLLVAAAIYITFVDGRYWLLGFVALAALPSFLPDSILNRFLSIGNLADSSSSYRMFIWLGTLRMLRDFWLVGIGPGTIAFNMVYPRYAYTGIEAPHSHNVYLQMMTETGVAGLVAFLLICIFFFQRIASGVKGLAKKSMDRIMGIAIASGIAAFLVQGVFDYVFYNYRVFLMFWMVLAFAMCLRYTSRKKEAAYD